jgi:hypothetical protein
MNYEALKFLENMAQKDLEKRNENRRIKSYNDDIFAKEYSTIHQLSLMLKKYDLKIKIIKD